MCKVLTQGAALAIPRITAQFYRRNMNKTQKLLTALGLVSGVAFTAAFAAVPNNTLLSMQIGDPSTYDPVPLRRHR